MRGMEGLQAAIKELLDIKNNAIGQELRTTFYTAADQTAKFAQRRYAHYGTAPTPFHTLVTTSGKKKGSVRPARAPRAPTSPNLALLQNAVRSRMVSRFNHRVEIAPWARHPDARLRDPGGIPLSLLAHWIENPTPVVITMTLRMLAYFRAISNPKRRTGIRGGHVIPNRRLNGAIIYTPRNRPVWRETAQYAVRTQVPHIIRGILRGIGKIVRKYGGKVR